MKSTLHLSVQHKKSHVNFLSDVMKGLRDSPNDDFCIYYLIHQFSILSEKSAIKFENFLIPYSVKWK